MKPHEPISIQEIRAAWERVSDAVVRTPLVRLNVDDSPAEVYLKLENLQPTGAFKLRGVLNTVRSAGKEQLEKGIWTVSSGNTAQAVAWCARRQGLGCTVAVLGYSAQAKLAAINRLGAETIKVSMTETVEILRTRKYEGVEGLFIHPFSDSTMMAGNGTIGLEILEDLPDVDAVIAPYGGGG